MTTPKKYLEEIPNLAYAKALAKEDFEFQYKFISALKSEFAIDAMTYFYHIEIDEPRMASEIVNKLKSSLSYLNMNEAHNFAEQHQEKLRIGDLSLHPQFKKILITVHKFLRKN